MTTDEIDGTTRDDRVALVGFCDDCEEWYKFVDDSNNVASRNHSCGEQPSNRLGYQITSQRTFNTSAKKMTKAQIKKMNGQR